MTEAGSLREGEIRPDELMAEQARRYAADVQWLVERRERFVDVRCPACDEEDGPISMCKFELDFRSCAGCGTVYMDPRPDQELLHEYYAGSQNYEYWNRVVFPASEDARRAKIFAPRARRVIEIAERHGAPLRALVDVGAGFGTFCEEVQHLDRFERVVALEPEPHLAATCRAKGLAVMELPVEEADLGDVDVITSFEVIEHLFSPRAFLSQCAGALRPGGLIIVTCPNVRGFDVVVLRELAGAVDSEHVNLFHPASLGRLLDERGFDVLETVTPGELDAELVRKKALEGAIDLSAQPFLEQVLLTRWDEVGETFQRFLRESGLSSNMWVVGRRR